MSQRLSAEQSRLLAKAAARRIVVLGFVAPWVQFATMRELLGAYGGNEYLIGLSLGLWLFFGGLGSSAAKWGRRPHSGSQCKERWLWFATAMLPVLSLIALRWARHHVFPAGAGLGLSSQMVVATLVHLPFCLLSGYLLARFSQEISHYRGAAGIGHSYFLDSIGGLVGGLLFVFPLSHFFGHLQIVGLAGAILLAGELLARDATSTEWRWRVFGTTSAAFLMFATFVGERPTLAWLVPAGKLVYEARSPYGQVLVSEMAGQRLYLRNGGLLFATNVPEYTEQLVHLALLSHEEPRDVAILGPPLNDIAQAALQHPLRALTFVQPDHALDQALQTCGDRVRDDKCDVVLSDPRSFLARQEKRFDVIVLNEPLPATLLANRLFTREFAHVTKKALVSGGVFAMPLGEFENYFDARRAATMSSIFQAMKAEFPTVDVLAGDTMMLVASDRPLNREFRQRFLQRNLRTVYVRLSYFDATVDSMERQLTIRQALSVNVRMNTDGFPIASYETLRRWLSEYGYAFGALELSLLAITLVFTLRMSRLQWFVFATGFSASGIEYVVIAALQIIVGTVYYLAPLLVALFMMGLLVGVAWGNAQNSVRALRRAFLAYLLTALAATLLLAFLLGGPVLPWRWRVDSSRDAVVASALLGLVLVVVGAGTGTTFAPAGKVGNDAARAKAAHLYAADFIGGAVGAILFSTLLVPLLGVAIAPGAAAFLMAAVFLGERVWQKSFAHPTS